MLQISSLRNQSSKRIEAISSLYMNVNIHFWLCFEANDNKHAVRCVNLVIVGINESHVQLNSVDLFWKIVFALINIHNVFAPSVVILLMFLLLTFHLSNFRDTFFRSRHRVFCLFYGPKYTTIRILISTINKKSFRRSEQRVTTVNKTLHAHYINITYVYRALKKTVCK